MPSETTVPTPEMVEACMGEARTLAGHTPSCSATRMLRDSGECVCFIASRASRIAQVLATRDARIRELERAKAEAERAAALTILGAIDKCPCIPADRASLDHLTNALAEREGAVPGLSCMWRRSHRGFWELHAQVEFQPCRVIIREMHYFDEVIEHPWGDTRGGAASVPAFKTLPTNYSYALLDAWALGQTAAARGLGRFLEVP